MAHWMHENQSIIAGRGLYVVKFEFSIETQQLLQQHKLEYINNDNEIFICEFIAYKHVCSISFYTYG